jgi:hypothetical protein
MVLRFVTKTFKEIFLAEWIPALLTALLGGAVVAYFAPKMQSQFTSEVALQKRKIDLWESIATDFTEYILWRNRLNSIALAEVELTQKKETVPKEMMQRKEQYRTERDKFANSLRRDFVFARYYFGETVKDKIEEFLSWNEKFARTTVEQLPPDAEYNK